MLRRRIASQLFVPRRPPPATHFRPMASSAPPSAGEAKRPAKPAPRRPPDLGDSKVIYSPEDIPLWRRIVSEWGGLIWFGSFMGIAWISKKWAEYNYDIVDQEYSQPRRHRKAYEE